MLLLKKRSMIKIGVWALRALYGLFILAGLFFLFLQTESGRKLLVQRPIEILARASDLQAKVGRVDGLLPFECHLDSLLLADSQGPVLQMQGLSLYWSPGALLRGRILIHNLDISLVKLLRRPVKGEDRPAPPSLRDEAPMGIPAIHISRFSLDRLVLEEAFLGEQAAFEVFSSFHAGRGAQNPKIQAIVSRVDQAGTFMNLKAFLAGQPERLSLSAHLRDASGMGLRALGLDPGPSNLTLEGEAPLHNWQGRLVAHASGLGTLAATVALRKAEDGFDFGINGSLERWGAALPQPLNRLIPEGLYPVLIKGRLSPGRELQIRRVALDGGWIGLEGSTLLGLKTGRIEARLHAEIRRVDPITQMLDKDIRGSGECDLTLSGPSRNPDVRLVGFLDQTEYAPLSARKLSLDLLLKPGISQEGGVIWDAQAKGSVNGLSYKKDPRIIPDQDFDWALAARVSRDLKIDCQSLSLKGDSLTAAFSGSLNGHTGSVDGVLEVDLKDIRDLSSRLGQDIGGRFHVSAGIQGNLLESLVQMKINGRLDDLSGVRPEGLQNLVGQGLRFEADASMDKDASLSLTDFKGIAKNFEITGQGALRMPGHAVSGEGKIELSDLSGLSHNLKGPVGPLTINMEVLGPLKNPRLDVRAHSDGFQLPGLFIGRLNANIHSEDLGVHPRGHWDLEAETSKGLIRAGSLLGLDSGRVELSRLFFDTRGNRLEGHLLVHLDNPALEGTVTGSHLDLSLTSAFFKGIEGGRADLEIRLSRVGTAQDVTFEMLCHDLSTPYAKVSTLDVKGELANLYNLPKGELQILMKDISRENLHLESVILSASGEKDRVTARGKANGKVIQTLGIEFQAEYLRDGPAARIGMRSLSGTWGDHRFHLETPFKINLDKEKWFLEEASLSIDKGQVLVRAHMEDSVSLDATLKNLPLGIVPEPYMPPLTGTLGGVVNLSGTKAKPHAKLSLEAKDILPREAQVAELQAHEVSLEGEIRDSLADLHVILRGFGEEPMEGRLRFPAVFSLSPAALSFPVEGTLRGEFSGDMDLSSFPVYLQQEDHLLEGKGQLHVAVNGSLKNPLVNGSFGIRQGEYENLRTGTILKNMEALLRFTKDRVVLETFRADDGGKGRLKGEGAFEILPSENFPFTGEIQLTGFQPLRSDDLKVDTDADLRILGSLSTSKVQGTILINSAELRLPDKLPPDVAEVERIEKGKTGNNEKRSTPDGLQSTQTIKLDVEVTIPGRMFVRGNGLESEWKGALRLSGTASEPRLEGTLSVVRGFYDLFGRRFSFNNGKLLFMGPLSPAMDVTADFKGKELVAKARLYGDINKMDLDLSSDPPHSSDEILSRILFGREASRLTPAQALRLAQAVNRLAGGKTVFDPLDKARQALGVDQLDIRQEGNKIDQTTLSVGKYMRDDVYFELEKGMGKGSGKVSVEVELTPNITLESEASEDSTGGLGVNWKWDY